MTANDVCKKYGVTRKFLRFYEQKGLIHPTREKHGQLDYRDYSDKEVERIGNIVYYRQAGFTGKEICEIMNTPGYDPSTPLIYAQRLIEKKTRKLMQIHEKLMQSLK